MGHQFTWPPQNQTWDRGLSLASISLSLERRNNSREEGTREHILFLVNGHSSIWPPQSWTWGQKMIWLKFLPYLNSYPGRNLIRVARSGLFIHAFVFWKIRVLICYQHFLRNFQRNLTNPFGIPKLSFFQYLTLIALRTVCIISFHPVEMSCISIHLLHCL